MQAIDIQFISHVIKYNLSYPTIEEFMFRKGVFAAKDAFINAENEVQVNYKVGHNKFSTWTESEMAKLTGYKKFSSHEVRQYAHNYSNANPASVNWVTAGGVTPVKDQGQCGSCWAFSSTGGLEGAHFVKSGNLLSFSEQQLVDCAGLRYGNFGCNGGLQQYAFNYYKNFYAESEAAYPYTGVDGSCAYNANNTTGVNVTSWAWVPPQSAVDMQTALVQQPLSISIQANQLCFQMYSSGVFDNAKCGTNLDHAVLAAGYGTDSASGLAYWLVKNSWGTSWGEQGYIRIAQVATGDGLCGCQMEPLYPTSNN